MGSSSLISQMMGAKIHRDIQFVSAPLRRKDFPTNQRFGSVFFANCLLGSSVDRRQCFNQLYSVGYGERCFVGRSHRLQAGTIEYPAADCDEFGLWPLRDDLNAACRRGCYAAGLSGDVLSYLPRLTAIGRKLHMIFRLFCIKTEYLLLVLWVYT